MTDATVKMRIYCDTLSYIFHHLGYRPQLRQCVNCDSPFKPVVNFSSPSKTGYYVFIAILLRVLCLWQSYSYATARRVRIKPELSSELEQVLHEYIRYILQRELKSLAWLQELKRECAAI